MSVTKCCRCNNSFQAGDDYVSNGNELVCMDCLDGYILERFDWCDIAEELGFHIREFTEVDEEPKLQPEGQLPGQLDMFGGVTDAV